MLEDVVRRIIDSELAYGEERRLYHYNCAETMLNGCDECFGLGLDRKARKMAEPFGKGMYVEKTCGALTGGLMALGVLFAQDKPTENSLMKEAAREWVERFEARFDSLDCKAIKEKHRHPQEKCAPVIMAAASLLEEIVESHRRKEEGTY